MALEHIETITKFLDKATVWILVLTFGYNATTKDYELTDPTSIVIDTIYNPDNEAEETNKTMTQYASQTGVYEYLFHKGTATASLESGHWRGEGRVIDGVGADAIITTFSFSFDVN